MNVTLIILVFNGDVSLSVSKRLADSPWLSNISVVFILILNVL